MEPDDKPCKPVIALCRTDDWFVVYINGKRVYDEHNNGAHHILGIIADTLGLFEVMDYGYYDEADMESMEWNFPELIQDLKMSTEQAVRLGLDAPSTT